MKISDRTRNLLIGYAAKASGDRKTQVAACVVFDDGKILVGANHLRDNHGLTEQQIADRVPEFYAAMKCAEQDLLDKARELGRGMAGATIYSTLFACPKCARQIADARVGCVISLAHRETKNGVFDNPLETSMKIFDEAGIKYNVGIVDNKLGRIKVDG